MHDTTGNLFHANNMQMPFNFVCSDAEMLPVEYPYKDKNQTSLFGKGDPEDNATLDDLHNKTILEG